MRCRTTQPDDVPACASCEAEGNPVPGDLPPGARLVGPGAPATEEPALVSVADQRAAGVPPEETVTIADQKAGVGLPAALAADDGPARPSYPKPV
jgi:hypothetical protein